MKKAFTLIEMLVVIGILGILMGVMLGTFSGGTDSARAAKCMSNLRNLTQAAISKAMADNAYPAAGSYAYMHLSNNSSGEASMVYYERVGWISWLSQNDPYHTHHGSRPSTYQKVANAAACCENDEDADFALTNGTLWVSMSRNRESYVCPLHKRLALRRHLPEPNWSYCMNAFFGYSSNAGSESTLGDGGVEFNKWYVKPDRRLMFAELPFAIEGSTDGSNEVSEDRAYATANDNTLNDCCLQYKAYVNGYAYNRAWNGTPEAIAFNHKSGKRYCAHVSFADGHTEKFMKARGDGGLNAVQLTALLCSAKQVSFDGFQYQVVSGTDDQESDAQD